MKKFGLRSFAWIFFVGIMILSFGRAHAETSSVRNALDYLAKQQNSDGGLKEQGQEISGGLHSAWAIQAFSSSGFNPNSVLNADKSLVDFEVSKACSYESPTDIERSILVLNSFGFDFDSLECDLDAKLQSFIDPVTGKIGNDLISTVFGVFALKSQRSPIPEPTLEYLTSQQQSDGGWSSGWGTESNLTSQVLQAIAIMGDKNSEEISLGKQFLKNLQMEDGGIKYSNDPWVMNPDSFSDAYTLQAIYALGESPEDPYWTKEGKTITSHLLGLQKNDGSFYFSVEAWGDSTPVWTTAVVIPSLNKLSYPVLVGELNNFNPPSTLPSPTPSVVISKTAPDVSEAISPKSIGNEQVAEPILPSSKTSTTILASNTTAEGYTSEPEAERDEATLADKPMQTALGESASRKKSTLPEFAYILIGLVTGCGVILLIKRLGFLSLVIVLILAPYSIASAAPGRAGLIIRHFNGEQKKFCVTSETFPLTSEEIFKIARVAFSLDNGFLVMLDGEQALSSWEQGSEDKYWSHWLDPGKGLTYANFGSQTRLIKDGYVDGWQIGSSEKVIKSLSLQEICGKDNHLGVLAATNTSTPSSGESSSPGEKNGLITKEVSGSPNARVSVSSPTESNTVTVSSGAKEVEAEKSPRVLGSESTKTQLPSKYLFLVGFLLPIFAALVYKFFKSAKVKQSVE